MPKLKGTGFSEKQAYLPGPGPCGRPSQLRATLVTPNCRKRLVIYRTPGEAGCGQVGNFQINCGRNLTKQSAGSASQSPASGETDGLESGEHNAQPQAGGPFLLWGGGLTSFQQRRAWACSRARGEHSMEAAFYPNCDSNACFLKELHHSARLARQELFSD